MNYLEAYKSYQGGKYEHCLKLLQSAKGDARTLDLRAQAHFMLKDYQKACNIYQDLIDRGGEFTKERKENLQTIVICSQLEKPGALKTVKDLPSTEDIILQVEKIDLRDRSIIPKPEPIKRSKKHKKRKIRLPKNYDPVAGPDPERWLPRRDRKGNAHKQKKRRQRPNIKTRAR